MLGAVIMSILVGIAVVLQGGMNKQISMSWGVSGVTMYNSLIVLLVSIVLFALINYTKVVDLPGYLKPSMGFSEGFKWWSIIPGFFGCLIVFGIPYSIIKIGALSTMTILICTQVLASVLWDVYIEKLPMNTYRIIGSVLTFVGAIIISIKE